MLKVVITVLLFSVHPSINAVETSLFTKILDKSNGDIDIAEARLLIESAVYGNVDIDKSLKNIEEIVKTIKTLDDYGESSIERMGAILRYVYTPADWNDNKAYAYDISDPFGHNNPFQKSVANYINTKLGNCVSMPILIAILAQRLDIDAKLAIAPSHAYIKFTDDNGVETNIEATSGTLLKDQRYISAFEIKSNALKHNIYLTALTNKEAVAFMLYELGRKLMKEGKEEKAHEITDLILEHHPKLVDGMLLKGNIYYFALQRKLKEAKKNNWPITGVLKMDLDDLSEQNILWYEKAEAMGWKEPSKDFNQRYAASIERFKNKSN
jgi:regulator of sirC expression with transglutaminase-like and TPR domain